MTKTVTRLFDTYAAMQNAVAELEAMGYSHAQIGVVAGALAGAPSRPGAAVKAEAEKSAGDDAGMGAAIGGIVGGTSGLLAGLGALAIPGLGPVVAAGWLVSAVVGAVVGAATLGAATGLVSALTRDGHDEADAKVYAEGVRRGGALVSVRTQEADQSRVQLAMARFGGIDAATRGADYRAAGWTGH